MKLKHTLNNLMWAIIFASLGSAVTGFLCLLHGKTTAKIETTKKVLIAHNTTKKIQIPVTITVYHPTAAQCDNTPFTTADGSKINPKRPQRWCGVSRDLLKYFRYGSEINLVIPLAPYLSGLWEIHDTGKADQKRHVDLLISNPDVCSINGKWKGFIIWH